MTRITTPNIKHLKENEIFVFGSNLGGRHGAGAARTAYMKFGAKMGVGVGLQGNSYALPTKDKYLNTLKREEILNYIDEFIDFAKSNTELTFYVTEVGCGLAGYEPKDIAPLFFSAMRVGNIYLPKRFWEILETLV